MVRLGRGLVLSFTRVTVSGLEHVPTTGPLILAANHMSNVDGGLLIAWVTPALGRPVHWMGKAEALDWPVAGWLLKQLGVFGVRRGTADTEAFRLAKAVLDDGRVLGAFPEGTRSPDGAMQRGKEGVTLLALRTGAPILPIGIADSGPVLAEGPAPVGLRRPPDDASRRAVRARTRPRPGRAQGVARGRDDAPDAAHRRASCPSAIGASTARCWRQHAPRTTGRETRPGHDVPADDAGDGGPGGRAPGGDGVVGEVDPA